MGLRLECEIRVDLLLVVGCWLLVVGCLLIAFAQLGIKRQDPDPRSPTSSRSRGSNVSVRGESLL